VYSKWVGDAKMEIPLLEERTMTAGLELSDTVLGQLIAARRKEFARLQKSRAEQRQRLEARSQAHFAAIKKGLPRDFRCRYGYAHQSAGRTDGGYQSRC
jgi:hypothetical protein